MRLLFLLALFLLMSFARAQEPLELHGKLPGPQLDLTTYTSYFEDLSGDTLPLSVIRTKSFRPFAQKNQSVLSRYAYPPVFANWLQFTLRNTHPTDTLKLFYQVGQAHSQIKTFRGDSQIDVTGFNQIPQRERPNPFAVPLVLPPGTGYDYWVCILNASGKLLPVTSELMTVEAAWKHDQQRARDLLPLLILMSALAGCVLFMCAYALYNYYLTRDKAFLYYSLYAGAALFHKIKAIDFLFSVGALMPYYPASIIKYPFNYGIIFIFYALFLNKLIQIQVLLPRLWRVTIILVMILVLLQGITLVEAFLGWPLMGRALYNEIVLVGGGLLSLLLLWAIIRSRSPLRAYLLGGNVLLFCLTLLPLVFFPFFIDRLPPWSFIHIMTLLAMLGSTAELFCFAMALAYRSQLSEMEKQQLQQQHSFELETKLAQQAEELQLQSQALEDQHLRQLEADFERKLADTEMVALRAQMNPHFIFNCLNSIKLYTLQNDSDQASDYLSKFAKLIRLVLENSRSELVSLKNELEALQLYSELEAMRFKQKVRFTIEVSPKIDTQYLRIPPLLLQPYVENAIWHGLMHKPEGGTVKIQVYQPTEQLLCIEITDDGVGRAKAAELKSKSTGKHKSFGLQVAADRIRMINQLYDTNTQVQIFDLVDALGESSGTKVVLEISVY